MQIGGQRMAWKRKLTKDIQYKWNKFIDEFTPDYILNKMTEKEFCIGYGSSNKSFCYIVERELDALGGVRGASSSKFGLYYSKKKQELVPTLKFGKTPKAAFEKIKKELSNLIINTKALNQFKDIKSEFSGMFKYKVMFLYNPNIMIPSFIQDDLRNFAIQLDLTPEENYEKLQLQLMNYKSINYPDLTPLEFAYLLYDKYGRFLTRKAINFNNRLDDELNYSDKVRELSKEVDIDYEIKPIPKTKPKKASGGIEYYGRSPRLAAIALKKANNTCELDKGHKSFIRKSGGTRYTEVHHLIPMCVQYKYDYSLDVPENIVSVCANCHREIHHGKNSKELIKKLYNERKDLLKQRGIFVTFEELLEYYKL